MQRLEREAALIDSMLTYVRLWYRGDLTARSGVYPVLFRYMREQGLAIAGDGCELWIADQFSAASAEESTAVIEIPVRPVIEPAE